MKNYFCIINLSSIAAIRNTLLKFKNFAGVMALALLLSACAAFTGRETAGEYLDDTAITTAVKTKILQDSTLKSFSIHVETFQNTVQLSGFVDSIKESQRAAQLAYNVKGVRSVKNNLVVRTKHRLKKSKVRR